MDNVLPADLLAMMRRGFAADAAYWPVRRRRRPSLAAEAAAFCPRAAAVLSSESGVFGVAGAQDNRRDDATPV